MGFTFHACQCFDVNPRIISMYDAIIVGMPPYNACSYVWYVFIAVVGFWWSSVVLFELFIRMIRLLSNAVS